MVETQLDRIENMLKILIQTNTGIEFKGAEIDNMSLSARVKNYNKKEVGSP